MDGSCAVRARGVLYALLFALGAGACDLDVATPGQGEEHEIESLSAVDAFVRGAGGKYAMAASGVAGMGGIYLAGALLGDELVHSGVRPDHRAFSDGLPRDHLNDVGELWAAASEARFVAEDLVARIKRIIASDLPRYPDLTVSTEASLVTSMLWAGFANRMMGDNFCHAVINGGPQQDRREFYRRAETYFSEAISTAIDVERDTLRQMAHAGRAQVRMLLDDWDGAVADAGQVGDFVTFSHTHGWHVFSDTDWNYVAVQSSQGRFTVWGTPFDGWLRRAGTTAGDPRSTIFQSAAVPLGEDRRRPFVRPLKFQATSSSINLVKGMEMRLIEAEAALRRGDVAGAVAKINEVRAFRRSPIGGLAVADRTLTALPNVSATTEQQAWELLMRERGIELYLEGRRLADLRRWAATPGWVNTTVVREAGQGAPTADPRRNVLQVPGDFCIPVSARERRTNPNLH